MTYTREQMRDVAAYFESYFSSAMYGWASGADVASMFRQLLEEVDRYKAAFALAVEVGAICERDSCHPDNCGMCADIWAALDGKESPDA